MSPAALTCWNQLQITSVTLALPVVFERQELLVDLTEWVAVMTGC